MNNLLTQGQALDLDQLTVQGQHYIGNLVKYRNFHTSKMNQYKTILQQAQYLVEQKQKPIPQSELPVWVKRRYPNVLRRRDLLRWEMDVLRDFYFVEIESPKPPLIEGLRNLLTSNTNFHQQDLFQDLYEFMRREYSQ